MKELLRKKYIKILLSLITLLVVIGIVGINVRSSQKDKDYKAHIAAAEKYLSDLDYEQAIAEYTKALEIDPKEEVVDALAQAYLDYAKSYADTGDYEKAASILEESYEKINPKEEVVDTLEQIYLAYAQAYIDAEDYDKAVSILKEKSERTGWESLQNMIVEVTALQEEKRIEEEKRASGMVEFPFQMSEITVRGYNLSRDYFAQIQELYPSEREEQWLDEDTYMNSEGVTSDGWGYGIYTEYWNSSEMKWLRVDRMNSGSWLYSVNYNNGGDATSVTLRIDNGNNYYGGKCEFGDAVNAPVIAGETYEDWCRVMQINQIKENNLRPEERDGNIGIWDEEGRLRCSASVWGDKPEYWIFSTEGCQGIYEESDMEGGRVCEFVFETIYYDAEGKWPIKRITVLISDGIITEITYHNWSI